MQQADRRRFWAVNLGHAANDMFMSMRGVLLTFISAYVLPMSTRQIGLALSLVEMSGALSQPFFGWLADKTGGRLLGAGGVGWTVTFFLLALGSVSLGMGYWPMLILMALAGLGSGAFHPVGSMHATGTDPRRAGRNAALFFMCGQIGLGIGPALAGVLLNNAHTSVNDRAQAVLGSDFPRLFIEHGTVTPILLMGLIALPAVALMAFTLPSRAAHRRDEAAITPAAQNGQTGWAAVPKLPFVTLFLAVAFRSLSNPAIVSFMPLMFQMKGWSPGEYGLLASSFWVASGVAGVWFGSLGDRYDSRRVILLSVIFSVPGIFFLPGLNGALAFGAAILIGTMSGSHSLIVVLAQSLLPGRRGLASGMILGLIFATGAAGNLIVGDLIDRVGVDGAFHLTALLTLAGSILWLWLPAERRVKVAEGQAVAVVAAEAK